MLKFPKWEDKPVHPANNAPEMSADELKVLAADIKKFGLQEPIIYWRDNREEANGSKGPFPVYLLDGRNRLTALRLLGINDPNKAPAGKLVESRTRTVNAIKLVSDLGKGGVQEPHWEVDTDPVAFHLSMNVYRRHLTSDQKRWQIKHAIIADPQANDSEVARKVGATNKTVAKVRAELDGPNWEIPKTDHLPIERAKAALRSDPTLSLNQVVKQANVGKSTAFKARNELQASGEIKQSERKAVPTSKARKQTKNEQATQATEEFVEWAIDLTKETKTPLITLITWFDNIDLKLAKKLLTQQLKQKE
jgi:ParB-like chromosome segregation protein Spo0J